jgi:hypothetical protein
MAAITAPPPGEPLSTDGWAALVATRALQREVPLVPLTVFGFQRDEEGGLTSGALDKLVSGAEAEPYMDSEARVVYKLFFLLPTGTLGKKLDFSTNGEGEFELTYRAARLEETVEKIRVLHDAGGHPTEIVGLSESGDYLIVKQPLAAFQPYSKGISSFPTEDLFIHDRLRACEALKAIPCVCPGFRQTIAVIWLDGAAWLIGDLHERNIMRDSLGAPTVIDALIGPVTAAAHNALPRLADTVSRAKTWRLEGFLPPEVDFMAVDDDEL